MQISAVLSYPISQSAITKPRSSPPHPLSAGCTTSGERQTVAAFDPDEMLVGTAVPALASTLPLLAAALPVGLCLRFGPIQGVSNAQARVPDPIVDPVERTPDKPAEHPHAPPPGARRRHHSSRPVNGSEALRRWRQCTA